MAVFGYNVACLYFRSRILRFGCSGLRLVVGAVGRTVLVVSGAARETCTSLSETRVAVYHVVRFPGTSCRPVINQLTT